MGDAWLRQGRADRAEEQFRLALQMAPSATAARNLALLLFNRGDYGEAVTYARRSVRARPEDAVGHLLLGAALAELRQWDESIAELQDAVRLDPGNADARSQLARVVELRAASVPGGRNR